MTETGNTKPKVCGSCGETFGCGADASSCWCSEVSVTPDILESLRETFADCLCPKCLVKESAKSRVPAT